MGFFNGVVFMSMLLAASTAWAERQVCGEDTILVKASVGQAVEIVLKNGVGDLVRSGDPSTLKIEHTSGHLFLTPLTASPAQVTVIDMQGRSYLIRCVMDQPADEKVVVGDCGDAEGVHKRQDIVMGLMRALIRGNVFAGATAKKADQVMFDDGKVRMHAVFIQELPQLLGYVMVVENLTAGQVLLPVQQMAFPGLLAVSSSRDDLFRGEDGYVYMVVAR